MSRNCTYQNYNTSHCQNPRSIRPKRGFCKKCLRYNLPEIINTTSINIINTIFTHSLIVFVNTLNRVSLKITQRFV